jgi:hypothetical protein
MPGEPVLRGGVVKRWMAAATVGLAAAGGVVMPGTAQASSGAWRQVYQADASGSFDQTAAISRSDIWSVGDTSTTAGKTVYQPFIRHFNGSSWQAVTIPHSSGSTADWVSASAANNVWVGGLKNSRDATSVVYRWNGARWAKIPLPAMTSLQDVVVLGPDNVWAFGDSGTVAYDIFHWNGSKWQYYLADDANFIPQDISASAPNNVWVSGFTYSGSKQVVAAYRWNGTAWHPVSMPHPVFDDAGPNVTAVSASNVWIGWDDITTSHVLHWDGRTWRTVTAAYYADPLDIVPDGKGGYWFGAQAIVTGNTWTTEEVPGFSGDFGGVTRIPGTTSFLLNAGVEAGGSATVKPTIFRFDL